MWHFASVRGYRKCLLDLAFSQFLKLKCGLGMSASKFYKLEQQRLFLEAEKISLFTNHGPTIGAYREGVLRDYIKRFMPSSLKVTSGFVSVNKNHADLIEGQSRQVDILICDTDQYVPLLEVDGFSVIRPESLRGCVEVKSSLTFYKNRNPEGSIETSDAYPLGGGYTTAYRWAGTLVDALENIKHCADACESRKTEGYFSSILAFDSTFETRKIYEALDSGSLQKQLGINHLRQLPISICVLSKFITFFFEIDMFESGKQYPIEHETFYNEMTAVKGSEEYPLQFFSAYLYNQVGYSHSKRPAESEGIHAGIGRVGIWSHHFDLCSGDL